MNLMNPDLYYRTLGLTEPNFNTLQHMSLADKENAIPKTHLYKLVNSMLELATESIINEPISFLEEWEMNVVLEILREETFVDLDPSQLWVKFLSVNEPLAFKIRDLDKKKQLKLILVVLYRRKSS